MYYIFMNTHVLKEGEKAAGEGIIHLVILGLIKLIVGLLTGLTVVIADAIRNFAETLGVFASYLGLKISRKSADIHFEYGYHKLETLAALVISIGIIIVGVLILQASIEAFYNPQEGKDRVFALTITIIAIVHSISLSKKFMKAGKKVNSLSLITSAKGKRMDVISGIAVLISIAANYKNIPYVEGIVSSLISIFIIKEGVLSAKESLFFLLDYWDDPKLVKKIKAIFRKEKELIISVKRLRLRRAGNFIFGEAFVEINPFAGIEDLREELDLLQGQIQKLSPYIKDFSIYSHITKAQSFKIAVPIKSGNNLNAKVASTLRETKAYLFVEIKNEKLGKFYIKKITAKDKTPVKLSNILKKEEINILINNKLNSLLYYYLRRTRHILIYPNFSNVNTVKNTIQLLLIDT